LPATRIQTLVEVALSVDESHRNHRYFEIGGGANRVAGKNSQAAAIRRQAIFQSNFHGKVCD
jgi:hypothetical protein